MKKIETAIALLTLLALAGASHAQEWWCPKCKKMVKGRFCPNHPEQKRPEQPETETVTLCRASGKPARRGCPTGRTRTYPKGQVPKQCNEDHTPPDPKQEVTLCAVSDKRYTTRCPETYTKLMAASKIRNLGECSLLHTPPREKVTYTICLTTGKRAITGCPKTQPREYWADDKLSECQEHRPWQEKFPHLAKYISAMKTINNRVDRSFLNPSMTFTMGSVSSADEHTVTLTPFRMGRTEVTAALWREYCEDTSNGKERISWPYALPRDKDDHPITHVSWEDIMGKDGQGGFCAWATRRSGVVLRLPTEAQWEFAASGGDGRTYPWGNNWDASKCQCSKTEEGDSGGTSRVGSYPAGPFGLCDMAGNVLEWCSDWHADKYLLGVPFNPTGPLSGTDHVLRGGSWCENDRDDFACAFRFYKTYLDGIPARNGFRLSSPSPSVGSAVSGTIQNRKARWGNVGKAVEIEHTPPSIGIGNAVAASGETATKTGGDISPQGQAGRAGSGGGASARASDGGDAKVDSKNEPNDKKKPIVKKNGDVVDRRPTGDSNKRNEDAERTFDPDPELTSDMKKRQIITNLRVRVTVDADGSHEEELIQGSGDDEIDQLILRTMQRWKWKPGYRDGEKSKQTLTFRYRININ